ncbi:CBASS cGAMP-activated phospholipase [Pandoraea commovens]|uniref:Patatin n=1 Tax=Pandoraea commovens TaxID=2508289 RepID=A0A5E4RJ65_9BURK|nr:CBASS cGAMP-activated phospholipase [Pandoraea commovens]VVD62594.1 patatin [Pandoraea commovens]
MNADPHAPQFHILALSGGGYRGLYTATVLRTLEEFFGKPLASHFDLICGTSAGGLLALGLAARIPAVDLQSMFVEDGKRIFDSRGLIRKALGKWVLAKHSSDGLKSVLVDRLGNRTIGDLEHRVLIPTVNCSTGKGQFFKTPHTPALASDHKRSLVDVGLATAAAPTYFPMHRIDGEGTFADGGLVGNSPGLFGLHEATQVLRVGTETKIRVLAIGTMTLGATVRGSAKLDCGILRWRSKVFDLVMSAQEGAVDYMLKHALGHDYLRIDDNATPEQSQDVASLDSVTTGATNVLLDRGAQAARRTLGDPRLDVFKSHIALSPTFYHGPNKTTESSTC